MFRSLMRFLGSGTGGGPRAAGAGRFTPGLEALDGRTMPSAVLVGGGIATGAAVLQSAESPHAPTPFGGASGGVLGDRTLGGAMGGVTADGGARGGVVQRSDGGAMGGVTADGGAAGGVTSDQGGANGSYEPLVRRGIGEEIPTQSLTRGIGEEIPQ